MNPSVTVPTETQIEDLVATFYARIRKHPSLGPIFERVIGDDWTPHLKQMCVKVNIAIMRTFVQLRRLMDTNRDLARKIEALEKKYDEQFAVVFEAIKQLITPPEPPRRRIGFHQS